jgi:hypothetical protein
MTDVTKRLLRILTNSLIVSVICILLGSLGNGDNIATNVFRFVGFYGSILTTGIFLICLIAFLISSIFKSK